MCTRSMIATAFLKHAVIFSMKISIFRNAFKWRAVIGNEMKFPPILFESTDDGGN